MRLSGPPPRCLKAVCRPVTSCERGSATTASASAAPQYRHRPAVEPRLPAGNTEHAIARLMLVATGSTGPDSLPRTFPAVEVGFSAARARRQQRRRPAEGDGGRPLLEGGLCRSGASEFSFAGTDPIRRTHLKVGSAAAEGTRGDRADERHSADSAREDRRQRRGTAFARPRPLPGCAPWPWRTSSRARRDAPTGRPGR